MRALFTSAVAFLVTLTAMTDAQDYDGMFLQYKRDFNRQYASAAEEASRRVIFETNMVRAAELQKQNPHATFGMTDYTDVDASEFKKTHHNADFTSVLKKRKPTPVEGSAGEKIDWRTKGAVTHVKNQKSCGGCWSFSTTGNIEGQWQIAGNTLVSLSEQELLSCDTQTQNDGCKGGLMDYAFEWLTEYKNGQIDTAASYPFVAGDGINPACSASGRTVGATISGHKDLPQSESAIATRVYNAGPVSIGVDGSSFQTYTGGILTNCQMVQLDHAVLIIGFDETNSPPYWIIKNSWGPSWGESGYIRVEKGTNQCGLKNSASTALVTAGPQPPSPPSPPVPVPPMTPAPVGPTPPSPSGATFTQKTCTDSTCASGCQSHSFPQNTCLSLTGGGSAKATCTSTDLTLTEYPTSTDCSGFSIPSTQPINQCVQDNSGSYLENLCSGSSIKGLTSEKLHSTRKI